MKIITKNKKAFFNYHVLSTFEAGIELTGDEVKSIRAGKISLEESYAVIRKGEVYLLNMHISPYTHAYTKADTSRRSRRLLLHKKEILKLIGQIKEKGLTLVPLRLYFNKRGFVKVELGLARHKSAPSKKKELRDKDLKREAQREIKGRRGD